MKNNKLFSVLLALLVCLSMVVSASATTESDFIFTLESDSSVEELDAAVVGAGETFTVSVNIEKNAGILYARPYVQFDNAKLKLVSVKAVVENVKVTAAENVVDKVAITIGDFMATISNPSGFTPVTATGVVAELTFEVLEKTDIQTSVELVVKQSYVMNANGKYDSTVSGEKLNVNVVSADHVCDETKTVEANNSAVEPNCTEAGKKADLLCAHCGKLVAEGEEIAALGHTNGDVVVENNVDPTCTANGSYDNVVYCTVCNAEVSRETVSVDALGHTWGEYVITTEPGCKTFGVQTRTCSVCAATEEDASVPATGEHTYGEWTVTIEPTTEVEGEETRTCSQCGEKETRSIEKLPPVEKSNNTLLIVIIVVVVLAGAGVAAYFVLKNKKK